MAERRIVCRHCLHRKGLCRLSGRICRALRMPGKLDRRSLRFRDREQIAGVVFVINGAVVSADRACRAVLRIIRRVKDRKDVRRGRALRAIRVHPDADKPARLIVCAFIEIEIPLRFPRCAQKGRALRAAGHRELPLERQITRLRVLLHNSKPTARPRTCAGSDIDIALIIDWRARTSHAEKAGPELRERTGRTVHLRRAEIAALRRKINPPGLFGIRERASLVAKVLQLEHLRNGILARLVLAEAQNARGSVHTALRAIVRADKNIVPDRDRAGPVKAARVFIAPDVLSRRRQADIVLCAGLRIIKSRVDPAFGHQNRAAVLSSGGKPAKRPFLRERILVECLDHAAVQRHIDRVPGDRRRDRAETVLPVHHLLHGHASVQRLDLIKRPPRRRIDKLTLHDRLPGIDGACRHALRRRADFSRPLELCIVRRGRLHVCNAHVASVSPEAGPRGHHRPRQQPEHQNQRQHQRDNSLLHTFLHVPGVFRLSSRKPSLCLRSLPQTKKLPHPIGAAAVFLRKLYARRLFPQRRIQPPCRSPDSHVRGFPRVLAQPSRFPNDRLSPMRSDSCIQCRAASFLLPVSSVRVPESPRVQTQDGGILLSETLYCPPGYL